MNKKEVKGEIIEKEKEIEKVEEVKKTEYNQNEKHSNKIVIVLITIIIALVLTFGAFIIGYSLKKSNNSSNSEKIELKHTDAVTVKSDGVYITDVSEVVDKVMPSIVAITSKTVISSGNYGPYRGTTYTAEGAGSGVIVSENDDEIFILTNQHVVDGASELSVKFIDDKSYDATVKGVSERMDVAIVSVKKKDIESSTLESIKIATIGDSEELKVGNGIIAIGNALGYGQSVTTGVVSALDREITTDEYTQEMIQIDAAINGGNSGGALLNSRGEVVGINTLKYSSKYNSNNASIEGMGFAIPMADIEKILDTLIKGENDEGNLVLGIEGYMTNSVQNAYYNLPVGFYVSKIESDSNADKSDLEIGNIITKVDGKEVTSIDTIKKALNKKEKGDKITLTVKYTSKNQYKEKEIEVTLN